MLTYYLILSSIFIGIDKGGEAGIGALGIAITILFSSTNTKHIIAMFTPVLFVSDIYIVISGRKSIDTVVVKQLGPSFLIGLLIGFLLISIFTDHYVRLIAGSGLILLSLIHGLMKYGSNFNILPLANKTISISHILKIQNILYDLKDHHNNHSSSLTIYIVGISSGILSTVANVAGPLISIYLVNSKLSLLAINSTRACIFTLANFIKIPMHMMNTNLRVYDLPMIIILIIVSLVSTYTTEKYILPRINNKILETISWVLILLAALFCLYV